MSAAPSTEELLAVVRRFAEDRDIDPGLISLETLLSDVGIDSLHAIDLIFEFEERYGISIRADEFRASTVGESLEFVRNLLSAPRPAGTAPRTAPQ